MVWFYYVEKSSMFILKNVSFCVPRGLERYEHQLYNEINDRLFCKKETKPHRSRPNECSFSVTRVCPVYRRKDKREQGETEWENSVKRSVQWRQFCSENWKDKCHEVWCLLERRQASPQGTFPETWTCTCKAWVRPVDPHISREDLMLLSTRNTHWSCRICLLSETFTGTTCIAKTTSNFNFLFWSSLGTNGFEKKKNH